MPSPLADRLLADVTLDDVRVLLRERRSAHEPDADGDLESMLRIVAGDVVASAPTTPDAVAYDLARTALIVGTVAKFEVVDFPEQGYAGPTLASEYTVLLARLRTLAGSGAWAGML